MCEECRSDRFTDAELLPFAGETSPRYETAVLAAAIRIVQEDTGLSMITMAERMQVSKTTLYRIARASTVKKRVAHHTMLALEDVRARYSRWSLIAATEKSDASLNSKV